VGTNSGLSQRYQKTVLDNDLRVVSEYLPHLRSATIGVWLHAGSRYEPPGQAGISHFLEHMLFKGTESRNARQLAETIDAVGGRLNAFTSKEYTCLYCQVVDVHFSLAAELLADMLQNTLLSPEEVAKERNVIVEEIRMYQDQPDELVFDLFGAALWDEHSLGRPIVGGIDTVSSISSSDLRDYRDREYDPRHAVVSVVGNVDPEEVVRVVDRHFGGWRGARRRGGFMTPAAAPSRRILTKDTEQVHLCLGATGEPLDSPGFFPMLVVSGVLGGSSSSRLFQLIREERGLAYAVQTFHTSYQDAGIFGVYAATGPENAREVLNLMLQGIGDLREAGMRQEELERVKEQLKAGLIIGLENTSNRMMRLGKGELLLGEIHSPDYLVERIDAVDRSGAEDWLRRNMAPERLALGAVGPVDADQLSQEP